jgi:cell fate regulator YaaT (PSP1 superfamily)
MSKVVGIRLRKNGKVYDFDSGHFVLKQGDSVVVNTEQGQALGVVCVEPRMIEDKDQSRVLKKVYRVANKKDVEKNLKGRDLEKDVYAFCYERTCKRELPMSLVSTERLFDGSKIMIYFSADGRVDFRELVKDLVKRFRTRIEMRQIGVRHQAKMVGGLGSCGRQLCCSSFLNNFEPVSIKMAKKQNLSLNPAKISGMCGRLMCCLTYEYEYYNRAKKNIPKIGKTINTTMGTGKVTRQNLLRETLTVMLESREEVEISPGEIIRDKGNSKPKKKQGGNKRKKRR